eukprot:6214122-Pleurochrysis_carterae.AAC.2
MAGHETRALQVDRLAAYVCRRELRHEHAVGDRVVVRSTPNLAAKPFQKRAHARPFADGCLYPK